MLLVKCMGRMGLWLELGSISDVRLRVKLQFSVEVKPG